VEHRRCTQKDLPFAGHVVNSQSGFALQRIGDYRPIRRGRLQTPVSAGVPEDCQVFVGSTDFDNPILASKSQPVVAGASSTSVAFFFSGKGEQHLHNRRK
jgi:hypothetical protein